MSNGYSLKLFFEDALTSTPIDRWGYFYPCLTATWRFIEATRPGALGPLNASYDSEPKFFGKGATWFCTELINDSAFLDDVEALAYFIFAQLPEAARTRGFVKLEELPQLKQEKLELLASRILSRVDTAHEQGKL